MHPLAYGPPNPIGPATIPDQPRTISPAADAASTPADPTTPAGTDPYELGVIAGEARNDGALALAPDTARPLTLDDRARQLLAPMGTPRPAGHPAGPVAFVRSMFPPGTAPAFTGLKVLTGDQPTPSIGAAGQIEVRQGNSWRASPQPWDNALFLGYHPTDAQ